MNMNWIKIEDQLPVNGDTVLVYSEDDDRWWMAVFRSYPNTINFEMEGEEYPIRSNDVTHWAKVNTP